MNTRKHLISVMALVSCMGLALTTSFSDDLLGKKKGGGGGGSSSGGSGEQGRRGGGGSSGGSGSSGGGSRGGGETRGGGGSSSGGGSSDQGRRGGGGSSGGDQGGGRRGGGSSDEGGRRGGGGSSSGGSSSGSGGSSDQGRRGGGSSNGGGSNQGGEIRSGGTRIILPGGGNNNGGSLLGKRGGGGSRSGNVNYGGSNSNLRNRDRNGGPINIGRAPVDVVRGSLGNQVRRADEIRVGNARIRFGYTHYDSRWCDDYFYYPYYAFDPYRNNIVCSPWYYYPQLPPYYVTTHCTIISSYVWSPFLGVRYNWSAPNYNNDGYYDNRRSSDVDYAIDDIVNSFERSDRRAAGRLVPRNGQVAIIIDGNYAYSINADDFYDTFMDAIDNTRTTDYQILDVQTRRDTIAVKARHDYEDPWGRRVSVYHYFRLEQDGRDWVIREFGTSGSR